MAPLRPSFSLLHSKERIFNKKKKKKAYHHWFSTITGRIMNLRAVAVGFCPLNTSFWPIFTEGVVMSLVVTLGDSGDRKPFTTSSMFEWYEKCLEAMTDLRITLKAEPLNHSWPPLQGFRRCTPMLETCSPCGLNPTRRVVWIIAESRHVCMGCYEVSNDRHNGRESRLQARRGAEVRIAIGWLGHTMALLQYPVRSFRFFRVSH
jgi:hypothetical protein